MIDLVIVTLIVGLVSIAALHVFGEVLFKKGGMVSFSESEKGLDRRAWIHFLLSPIVIASLFITLVTKVLYGVALASTPLYLAGGVYLAAIAVLSVIAGRYVFGERLRRIQIIGFVLVVFGLVLLV